MRDLIESFGEVKKTAAWIDELWIVFAMSCKVRISCISVDLFALKTC